jgi:predicted Zn-dependent peptidase
VYSGTASYADAGALAIYAGTSPGQVDAVLDLVDIELDRLRTDGITDDELDVARGYLTGSYVLGLEDSGSRMSRLGAHVLARGVVRPVDEQIARYEAVTHDDVAKVIDRVLGGPRTLAAVGPVTKKALAARAG